MTTQHLEIFDEKFENLSELVLNWIGDYIEPNNEILQELRERVPDIVAMMTKRVRNDTIDMVLAMFPFKHPATEKRELKQGFYQGCKFVNETATWRLHNLKIK